MNFLDVIAPATKTTCGEQALAAGGPAVTILAATTRERYVLNFILGQSAAGLVPNNVIVLRTLIGHIEIVRHVAWVPSNGLLLNVRLPVSPIDTGLELINLGVAGATVEYTLVYADISPNSFSPIVIGPG